MWPQTKLKPHYRPSNVCFQLSAAAHMFAQNVEARPMGHIPSLKTQKHTYIFQGCTRNGTVVLRNGYFGTERIMRNGTVSFAERNGSERNGCKVWNGTERFFSERNGCGTVAWYRKQWQTLLKWLDYTVWPGKV